MPVQTPAIVTLSYDRDSTNQIVVVVSPPVIQVSPGQVIRFTRSDSLPGTLRITFKDKDFFSCNNPHFHVDGAFHEGDGEVKVTSIPRRTTYACDLLDADGNRIGGSREDGGGAVEPERN